MIAIVEHAWGTEETWASTELYLARTLILRAGATLGPTSNTTREGTLRVQRGSIMLEIVGGGGPRALSVGDTAQLPAGVTYTIRARDEAELTDVSAERRRAFAPSLAPPDPEVVIQDRAELKLDAPAPPRPAVERPGAPVLVIVEDDLLIQDILLRAFRGSYTIYRADDGVHGLELIKSLPPVDLVITDLMMPRMNGLEMLRNLKADPVRAKIPVIVLTAKATSADVAAAINAGARSYVTKPFKLKELISQVDKIIASRQGA